MRQCPRCGENRQANFGRNRRNSDGLEYYCRSCRRTINREARTKNRLSSRKAKAARLMRPGNMERQRASEAAWQSKYPERHQAHLAVYSALKRGQIIKPTKCQNCGETARLHGHHEDYSKRLEVRWLCARCHQRLHAGIALVESERGESEGR